MAFALLEAKKTYSAESILVAWCAAHKVDLCAKALEREPYVNVVLRVVRRLCTHITSSQSAQQHLKSLHQLLDDEKPLPSQPSFAPHRFISHCKPAKALSLSFQEVTSYLHHLKANGADHERHWACSLDVDVGELKLWLVVAAVADMLGILNLLNLRTQRSELRVLQIQPMLSSCRSSLDRYVQPDDGVLCKAWRGDFLRPDIVGNF